LKLRWCKLYQLRIATEKRPRLDLGLFFWKKHMERIKGKKLKMRQIWRNEKVIPVTPIKIAVIPEKSEEIIKDGVKVTISGQSKGRGFQGTVKRHGFHGGPKTHGQKNRLRAPGSIGSTAPQRVMKGRKMAGRMGNTRVTIKNLEVVGFDRESATILLRGAIPGFINGIIELKI